MNVTLKEENGEGEFDERKEECDAAFITLDTLAESLQCTV
jgi:hypothetical protein